MCSLASIGFDESDYRKRFFNAFGPGSEYDNPAYSKLKHDSSQLPIKGKWPNLQLRRFAQCHAEGKTLQDIEDEDLTSPDAIPRLIALVALYAGKDAFMKVADRAVLILQSYDMSTAIVLGILRIIEQYVLYGDTKENLVEGVIKELKSPDRTMPLPLDHMVAGHFQAVLDKKDLSVFEATKAFGKA